MPESTEHDNFHWHCEVAALVMNALPGNAATKHYVRDAIRMATLSLTGANGIKYASSKAKRVQSESGTEWNRCGLIREHVVPIGEIYDRIVLALAFPVVRSSHGKHAAFMPHDERRNKLGKGERTLVFGNPRPWQIAEIVRQWSVLAYITKEEDTLLRERRLHDRMPGDWDGQDKFARYRACGIEWSAIE